MTRINKYYKKNDNYEKIFNNDIKKQQTSSNMKNDIYKLYFKNKKHPMNYPLSIKARKFLLGFVKNVFVIV